MTDREPRCTLVSAINGGVMRVYVAGPYTKGDVALNVRRAIGAAEALVEMGHTPLVPLLTHLWHLMSPHPWEYWMALDMAWLPVCDGLFRLPGESKGADVEVGRARELGIPVFTDLAVLRLTVQAEQ